MQKNGLSKYPPSEYNIGDEVYVKFIGKDERVYRGGSSIAAPRVLEGIVIATNKDLHKYKVKYTTQEKTTSRDWFRVDMITSKIASKEREKQRKAKENKKRKNINLQGENQRVLNILQELNDIITESRVMSTSYKEAMHDKMIGLQQNAAKEDLHVDRDIPSDGNCMFHAMSLQLSRVDVQISYTRLRHMIVDFLRNNPVLDLSDGTVDFRDFTVDVDWNGYLERMERMENGAQSIGEHDDCAYHNILCEVCGTFDCNTCNSLNNTNEILCHRCGTIHIENQCLLESSEYIKQNDCNKDHDKFDVDLDANSTLDSMLEENFDPDDDNEISIGKPHKGPNDSTDTLHENDILLSNDQNFELINKWLQHKLLEFEDQPFGKGILLSKDERSMVFYHFLKLHGFVLPFKHEIDGEFILVNHPFMDLYDDFRSYMTLIFSGLYVVYLTNDVRRWASLFNHTCMFNIYSNCIITLNDDSNYDLVQYLLRIRNPEQEEDYNSDEPEE
ncbi:unnamed protein product [Mytilus edulis]|uniref:OTU domain-containing protein n=1 Tax=Mytilus edulis TaxID=6550 RepID=A0A8S3UVT8_MYTED|nr:unnamed protein product [Mytilus edulis]